MVAAACVALVPFSMLAKVASRPPREVPGNIRVQQIGTICNAIMRSAHRMPFRAKCFEQGLAAVWLLRRRGVATTLHYGMAKQDEKFVAHVWVMAGEMGVVGCENREEFHELARFQPR